jgi:DNA-binding XRE family transcriptional regulator
VAVRSLSHIALLKPSGTVDIQIYGFQWIVIMRERLLVKNTNNGGKEAFMKYSLNWPAFKLIYAMQYTSNNELVKGEEFIHNHYKHHSQAEKFDSGNLLRVIGERIIKERQKQGISQDVLALQLDIPVELLDSIEKGQYTDLLVDDIFFISDHLGISILNKEKLDELLRLLYT